jgi:hypothetical protein
MNTKCSLKLRDERGVRLFGNRVLKICLDVREIIRKLKKVHNEESVNLYSRPILLERSNESG